MASLYITEFQASGNSESGAQLQVGMQPAGWFDGDMLDNPAPVATIARTTGPRGSSCSDKWVAVTRVTED